MRVKSWRWYRRPCRLACLTRLCVTSSSPIRQWRRDWGRCSELSRRDRPPTPPRRRTIRLVVTGAAMAVRMRQWQRGCLRLFAANRANGSRYPRGRPENRCRMQADRQLSGWPQQTEIEGSQTSTTYRPGQAAGPGKLELTEKALIDPPPGHVRIRVEACGVCHSDSLTVEGAFPIKWPRVPGHEAIGKIDALGAGVQGWSVGQRVGVGFLAGPCGRCRPCRG